MQRLLPMGRAASRRSREADFLAAEITVINRELAQEALAERAGPSADDRPGR